jgi:hypothetical protein
VALTAYQRRLLHAAFHEAGHAAAALALAFPVERVWIGPGTDPRGWGCVEIPTGRTWPAWALALALAGGAGDSLAFAELAAAGEPSTGGHVPGELYLQGPDRLQADALAPHCPWIARADLAILAWSRRPDVRPVVERIARELIRRLIAGGNGRGEIAGAELAAVALPGARNGSLGAWGEPLRLAFPTSAEPSPVFSA